MRLALEETARELFTYLAFKDMCINFAKCHLMLIGKQYLDIIPSTTIRIFHQDVHEEEDIKLLGLIIDNKLSFEKYIIGLAAKCNTNIQFLWRTAKDRSVPHRRLLTNALVLSHLNYCDSVYHSFLTDKLCGLLSSVQLKALRFVCCTRSGQRDKI